MKTEEHKRYMREYMRKRRLDPAFRDYTRRMQDTFARTIEGRWHDGRSKAKRRGLEWSLTIEQYRVIVEDKRCHYCSAAIAVKSAGLDRMDNSKGYVLGNVVPCCWDCNTMKGKHLTYDEMKFIWAVRRQKVYA